MLILRIAFFLVALAFVGVISWNVLGPVTFDIDERYAGDFREGALEGKQLSNEGVQLLKNWIETRSRPMWDPYQILWHQFWYNAVTEHYDLKLWVEPEDISAHHYGVYMSGKMLFLRREYTGRNRVLATDFTVDELSKALKPFTYDRLKPR